MVTFWPSLRILGLKVMAVWWTKISSPSDLVIKPKPLVLLNHLTWPVTALSEFDVDLTFLGVCFGDDLLNLCVNSDDNIVIIKILAPAISSMSISND